MEKYIMITHKKDHWEEKPNTGYPPKMLNNGLSYEKVKQNEQKNEVVFIKTSQVSGKDKVEEVWIGYILIIPNLSNHLIMNEAYKY